MNSTISKVAAAALHHPHPPTRCARTSGAPPHRFSFSVVNLPILSHVDTLNSFVILYICTNRKNAKCPVRSARGEAHRSWQPRSVRISKILLLRGSPSNNPILLTDPELLLRLHPIWYEITKLWNRQTHENKDGYFHQPLTVTDYSDRGAWRISNFGIKIRQYLKFKWYNFKEVPWHFQYYQRK